MVLTNLLILSLLSLSRTQDAQYKFHEAVGQIIKDQSGNGHHAVVGTTLVQQQSDPILTTRGAHFISSSQITFPPSVLQIASLEFQSSFTFSGFLMFQQNFDIGTMRYPDSTDIIEFKATASTLQCFVNDHQGSNNFGQITSENEWVFVSCSLLEQEDGFSTMYVGINQQVEITTIETVLSNTKYNEFYMGSSFDYAIMYNFLIQSSATSGVVGGNYACQGCSVCLDTSECISTCEEPLYDDSCELECDCDGNSCNSQEVCLQCLTTECLGDFCQPDDYTACIDIESTQYCGTKDLLEGESGFLGCDWSANCISDCDQCENSTTCYKCDQGKFLDLSTLTCVDTCSQNTFQNDNFYPQCELCHINCQTCNGPNENDCLSCSDINAVLNQGTCECAQGYYAEQSGQVDIQPPLSCAQCHSNCKTCFGSGPDECEECSDQNAQNIQGSCQCIDGYYEDTTEEQQDTITCLQCHPECATCNGGNSDNCLSCTDPNAESIQDICQCVDGYYGIINELRFQECLPCGVECATCIEDADYCASCNNDLAVVEDGQCSCDQGFNQISQDPLLCQQQGCAQDCQTCDSSDSNYCFTCLQEYASPNEETGTCHCNPTFYTASTDPLECTCQGENTEISEENECVCQRGTTQISSDPLECEIPQQFECFQDCQTCDGPDFHDCLTCVDEFASPVAGVCECIQGYEAISQNPLKCEQQCHKNCATCEGPQQTDCLTCFDNNSEIGTQGVCECLPGYYQAWNEPQICQVCDSSCQTCSGGAKSQCLTCTDQEVGMNSVPGYCECPDRTIQVSLDPLECLQCPDHCMDCTDQDCFGCDYGYFLNEDFECEMCQHPCLDCQSQEICFECDKYYFLNNGVCQRCQEYCSECTFNSTCVTCFDTFQLVEGDCKCSYFHLLNQQQEFCYFKVLKVELSVENDYILFHFNQDLLNDFSEMDVYQTYILPEYIPVQIRVFKISDTEYKGELVYEYEFPSDMTSVYIFLNQMEGSDGALLNDLSYQVLIDAQEAQIIVYEQPETEELTPAEELEQEVQKEAGPVTSTSFAASSGMMFIIMDNPSAIWTFINTAQILYYMPIQNVGIPQHLQSFWESFGATFYQIPNLGNLILGDQYQTALPPDNWYGYDEFQTTSFLINSGEVLFVGLVTFAFLPIFIGVFYFFKKVVKSGKIKKYAKSKIKDFKWCFFIRFWLEAFIDMVAAALLRLGVIEEDGFDFQAFFCLVYLILAFASVFGFFYFIYYFQDKIASQDKLLKTRYGSIFEEFTNDKGYWSMVYYPVFCLRRILYIFILYFLYDFPLLQTLSNGFHSLCIVIFLIKYKPFTQASLNFLNIAAEIAVTVSFFLQSFFLLELSEQQEKTVQWIIVLSVLSVLIVSYFYTIGNMCSAVKKYYRKRKGKTVMPKTGRMECLDEQDQQVVIIDDPKLSKKLSKKLIKLKTKDMRFDKDIEEKSLNTFRQNSPIRQSEIIYTPQNESQEDSSLKQGSYQENASPTLEGEKQSEEPERPFSLQVNPTLRLTPQVSKKQRPFSLQIEPMFEEIISEIQDQENLDPMSIESPREFEKELLHLKRNKEEISFSQNVSDNPQQLSQSIDDEPDYPENHRQLIQ